MVVDGFRLANPEKLLILEAEFRTASSVIENLRPTEDEAKVRKKRLKELREKKMQNEARGIQEILEAEFSKAEVAEIWMSELNEDEIRLLNDVLRARQIQFV